jgi:hypothetical protein
MSAIPLQKYGEEEYPMTPKSTLHYWATTGYYKNEGPLAGRVKRMGGRWYVSIGSDDPVVDDVVNSIKSLMGKVA